MFGVGRAGTLGERGGVLDARLRGHDRPRRPAKAGVHVRRRAAGALGERGGVLDARLRGHDGSCHPREGGGPCSAWGAQGRWLSAAASWMPACAGMTRLFTPAKAGVHVRS